MTIQELVQRVHQLAEDYNQTHEGTLAINYHKGQYRLIHSKAPTFSYYISHFNPLSDDATKTHIQEVFETVKGLIAIHKTLNDKLRSNDIHSYYDDRIELYDGKHQTVLIPLSEKLPLLVIQVTLLQQHVTVSLSLQTVPLTLKPTPTVVLP